MHKNIEKYFFKPKAIQEIISTANVVFDTNALLSAYQWKEVVFQEVLKVLQKLSDESRLKIPPQVFKEFIHQRPLRIAEAIEKVEDILRNIQNPKKLGPTLPLLGLIDTEGKYEASEGDYAESRENYKNELKELVKQLKDFFNDDIVLDSLKPFFKEIEFEQMDREKDIITAAKARASERIPPLAGGDAGKKENQYGDYFVWDYILSLKGDVIFVTTDFKEDWFHQVGSGKEKAAVSPRRELIEEFYEVSAGNTFSIISLKDFLPKYDPHLDEEIVEYLGPVEVNEERFYFEMSCTVLRASKVANIHNSINEKLDPYFLYREVMIEPSEFSMKLNVGDDFYVMIILSEEIETNLLHRIIDEKNALFKVNIARRKPALIHNSYSQMIMF